MTENGFTQNLPLISKSLPKDSKNNYLSKLEEIEAFLSKYFMDLTKHGDDRNDRFEIESLVLQNLTVLNLELKKTDLIQASGFIYPSQQSIEFSQTILLKIARLIWRFLFQIENKSIVPVLNESLCLIFIREELEVTNIGKDSIKGLPSFQQIQIAEEFHMFLVEILEGLYQFLILINRNELRKRFTGFFFAYSYFKIPYFQAIINECFNIRVINQNHNSVVEKITDKWQIDFYTYFAQKSPKFASQMSDSKNVLKKDWKSVFFSKDLIFYYFLIEYLKLLPRLFSIGWSTNWNEIPGYETLLDIFHKELMSKDIIAWSDLAIECQMEYFTNKKLMSRFFQATIEKTKLS